MVLDGLTTFSAATSDYPPQQSQHGLEHSPEEAEVRQLADLFGQQRGHLAQDLPQEAQGRVAHNRGQDALDLIDEGGSEGLRNRFLLFTNPGTHVGTLSEPAGKFQPHVSSTRFPSQVHTSACERFQYALEAVISRSVEPAEGCGDESFHFGKSAFKTERLTEHPDCAPN